MPQGKETDILIPVMGMTGAGKSFFINTLLKHQEMTVSGGLGSCTSELGFGYMGTIEGCPALENYRIVLVDTPGFDDSHNPDLVVLERIATFLEDSCKKGAKLGGVIYLHDISTTPISSAARRNIKMFQSLCGDDVLGTHSVVLGTTKWVYGVPDSELRHGQLLAEYWKDLVEKGARVCRFDNTYESAWSFIRLLLSLPEGRSLNQVVLRVQNELVDKKMAVAQTGAGQKLGTSETAPPTAFARFRDLFNFSSKFIRKFKGSR